MNHVSPCGRLRLALQKNAYFASDRTVAKPFDSKASFDLSGMGNRVMKSEAGFGGNCNKRGIRILWQVLAKAIRHCCIHPLIVNSIVDMPVNVVVIPTRGYIGEDSISLKGFYLF
tara:strand:- start:130 stop:474 length:345 start_codon:yes stop_codon:yes gene_type:complete